MQILGDGTGAVTHLWERDCSIQRRHQKLIEIAPSPALSRDVRDRIIDAAVRLGGGHATTTNLGTFEFLVDEGRRRAFVFIEANARLQVEHTVTEEVTGIDLVDDAARARRRRVARRACACVRPMSRRRVATRCSCA